MVTRSKRTENDYAAYNPWGANGSGSVKTQFDRESLPSDTMQWLHNLVPGDKVAVIYVDWSEIRAVIYTKIKKITPTGIVVTDSNHRFKDEISTGGLQSDVYLLPRSEKLDKAIAIFKKYSQ